MNQQKEKHQFHCNKKIRLWWLVLYLSQSLSENKYSKSRNVGIFQSVGSNKTRRCPHQMLLKHRNTRIISLQQRLNRFPHLLLLNLQRKV